MKIQGVGHVVLKVRDLPRAARFYRDILGLNEVARFPGKMVFFSAGTNHHDLAVLSVGPEAPDPPPDAPGLYHVALKIGDSLEELIRGHPGADPGPETSLGESIDIRRRNGIKTSIRAKRSARSRKSSMKASTRACSAVER